jgi:hypothetical protein
VLHQKWYPLIGAANRLEWSDLWPPLVISGVITSAFAIACAMFYTRQRRNLAYGVLVAMLPAMWFWTWPRVMPFMVSAEPYIHLGHQLQSRLSDEQRSVLRYVGTQDSRLLWYGDNRLPRLIDQLDLLAEQDGKRDLTWERQRYAQEVIDRLSDDEFILLAITVDDYVLLQGYGPVGTARAGTPNAAQLSLDDARVW